MTIRIPILLLVLLTMPLVPGAHAAPPLPVGPVAAIDLIEARPFLLETGYVHEWRADRPTVDAGYLLVLKVDPATVYPRQTEEPVLYVGEQTAQRVNVGYTSGVIVVVVPAARTADGAVALDPAKAPIWFGAPALPEQLTAAAIHDAATVATQAGIRPLPAAKVERARARGGAAVTYADRAALLWAAGDLIRRHVPDEAEVADNLQVPAVPSP